MAALPFVKVTSSSFLCHPHHLVALSWHTSKSIAQSRFPWWGNWAQTPENQCISVGKKLNTLVSGSWMGPALCVGLRTDMQFWDPANSFLLIQKLTLLILLLYFHAIQTKDQGVLSEQNASLTPQLLHESRVLYPSQPARCIYRDDG